jgi:hypothetical protein
MVAQLLARVDLVVVVKVLHRQQVQPLALLVPLIPGEGEVEAATMEQTEPTVEQAVPG